MASPLVRRGAIYPPIGNAQNAAQAKQSLKWWSFKAY